LTGFTGLTGCSFFSPFPEEREKENPPCGGKRLSCSGLRNEEIVVRAIDRRMPGAWCFFRQDLLDYFFLFSFSGRKGERESACGGGKI